MNQNLISYYNDRAKEYEKVYQNPDEQGDLLKATGIFQALFYGKNVFEIACGTGYWTEQIAETANAVLATDINESVISIAQQKPSNKKVTFAIADMYCFVPDNKFEGVFGGFIWSHILRQDLDTFIDKIKEFLEPGGTIVFIDSNPVDGTKHDLSNITKTDEYGNTFQKRQLENGAEHLVLKNFPTKDFLVEKLSRIGTKINLVHLEYYWIVSCTLRT